MVLRTYMEYAVPNCRAIWNNKWVVLRQCINYIVLEFAAYVVSGAKIQSGIEVVEIFSLHLHSLKFHTIFTFINVYCLPM